jgi:hypothetical protein
MFGFSNAVRPFTSCEQKTLGPRSVGGRRMDAMRSVTTLVDARSPVQGTLATQHGQYETWWRHLAALLFRRQIDESNRIGSGAPTQFAAPGSSLDC